MLQIDIITLFPEMFAGQFEHSIIKRAIEKRLIQIKLHQLRNYTSDKHHTVDDTPFGGGEGMVLKAEPLFKAVESVSTEAEADDAPDATYTVLTSPQGAQFDQQMAERLALKKQLVIVCGHYEGVDQRFVENGVDQQISIGNYILTGGEPAALVIVDVVTRLIPGVIGNPASVQFDSFSPSKDRKLKAPVYTRPAVFRNWKVPEVLLSGDHARIAEWRQKHTS